MLYKILVIFLLFVSSCRTKKIDYTSNSKVKSDIIELDTPIDWLDSYTFLYQKNLSIDTNLILLAKTGANDTTEIIQIYENKKYVKLIYYSQTPYQFNKGRKNNPEKKQLHNFTGISFESTQSFWDSVKNEIIQLKLSSEISENFPGCCDLTTYRILLNGKFYFNSNDYNQFKMRPFFNKFKSVIRVN
jgi:hypothetical protein